MTTFDDFWNTYPRKKDKLDAKKAWQQMTREYPPEEIMAGLLRNLSAIKALEPQFQKYPAGWLRKGAWMNEPEPAPKPRNYADTLRGMFNGSDGMGSSGLHVQRISGRH